MREFSIPVYYARAVLQNTVPLGLDPMQLLRKNRISPRLLLEDNAQISVERFADLQVSTMLALQDESLGYSSHRQPIGSWSMMCHAVMGSDSLGQGLHRYCRFYQLFPGDWQPGFETSGDTTTLKLQSTNHSVKAAPYYHELLLFNLHRFASWLVQEHLPMQSVQFQHQPAPTVASYRHMFLGNPVEFGQAESALVFSAALLDKRVQQNEQSLRHFLRHPVLMMLTQHFARDSWTVRVRELVRRSMRDMPELQQVAGQLELHPQTLRRRLSQEGTTFKDIKNQLRRDTALHFLGKQGLSIEEIAYRSGFSESSAFIRAFKTWTGVTPYSYRKGI